MAILNIDSKDYQALYASIDSNVLIRGFQHFKYRFILPVFRRVRTDESCLDVGCARGNFLLYLKKNGYKNLSGLDLDDALYPEIAAFANFHVGSITDPNLDLVARFDCILIQCMLHHLDPADLKQVALNVGKHLKPNGRVFIYEPNMASFIGRLFYFYLLRLFPALYRATMAEKPEQLAFCSAWPHFVESLRSQGIEVTRHSERLFFKSLVGIAV